LVAREELEAFFVNYHSLSSHHYTIIGVREPRAARRRLNQGRRAARQR